MKNAQGGRLSNAQILQAVRDVEAKRFGSVIIKIRNGIACFMEKLVTEQVKPNSTQQDRKMEG